jgi:hypothetical protein
MSARPTVTVQRTHRSILSVCRCICRGLGCRRTCSRLPLAIAPRRWYDRAIQQRVLEWLLSALSLHQAGERARLDRRTVRRLCASLVLHSQDLSVTALVTISHFNLKK